MDNADNLASMLVAAGVSHIHRQLQQSFYYSQNNNTYDTSGGSGINGSDPNTNPPLPPPSSSPMASDSSRNRTILTILYVCVLSLCFITPLFYYLRLHLEDRHARRLRELEIAGIRSALERSSMEDNAQNNSEQSRAMRRKYIEERKARIVQLFAPVKMVLKRENFPHLLEEEEAGSVAAAPIEQRQQLERAAVAPVASGNNTNELQQHQVTRLDSGDYSDLYEDVEAPPPALNENNKDDYGGSCEDLTTNDEEENLMILVPVQGLFFTEDGAAIPSPPDPAAAETAIINTTANREMRLAPGVCTICLSTYKVGSEVVWSSNAACEHCFHADCIERWLLRQREGPLCPCCRRDFVIDPYDVDGDDNEYLDDENDGNANDQVEGVRGENEQEVEGGSGEVANRRRSWRNSSRTGAQPPPNTDDGNWPLFVWDGPSGSDREGSSHV